MPYLLVLLAFGIIALAVWWLIASLDAVMPWVSDTDDELDGMGAADAETMQRIEDATVAEWKQQRADRQAVQDLLAESHGG
jgi:hypothetical protein